MSVVLAGIEDREERWECVCLVWRDFFILRGQNRVGRIQIVCWFVVVMEVRVLTTYPHFGVKTKGCDNGVLSICSV